MTILTFILDVIITVCTTFMVMFGDHLQERCFGQYFGALFGNNTGET